MNKIVVYRDPDFLTLGSVRNATEAAEQAGVAARQAADDAATAVTTAQAALQEIEDSKPVGYAPQVPSPAERQQARDNLGLRTAAVAERSDLGFRSFETREDFVNATIDGLYEGAVIYAQGVAYLRQSGSTEIPDLPGWTELDFPTRDQVFAPDADIILRVPSAFSTVQSALDAGYRRFYGASRKVRILIESGHQLTHGWSINGGDWSQFIIESEDPVVRPVQAGFIPVDSSEVSESTNAICYYKSCRAPKLGCVIRAWGQNDYDGIICFSNVYLEVLPACGVQNTRMNFEMRQGGCLSANKSIWNDALRGNMRLTNGVQFSIAEAELHGGWSDYSNITPQPSPSVGALRISRGSSGTAQYVKVYNSEARCVTVARSFVALNNADLRNTGQGGGGSIPLQLLSGAVVVANYATYNEQPLLSSNVAPPEQVLNSPSRNGVVFSEAGTVEEQRQALELGTASTEDVVVSAKDSTPGRVTVVGSFGWGATDSGITPDGNDLDNIDNPSALLTALQSTSGDKGPQGGGTYLNLRNAINVEQLSVRGWGSGRGVSFRSYSSNSWREWFSLLGTHNTTIDANGFVKEASPVVKVFSDGIETNSDAGQQDIKFDRVSEGVYTLSNTSGLAQSGWRVEVPQDDNGNRIVHVTLTDDDGTISLETRVPLWVNGHLVGGDPMDIPSGRWVDIRLQEGPSEPEMVI